MSLSLSDAYGEIRGRIDSAVARAQRPPDSVTLIAVSKKQAIEKIEALYRLGHRDFGENYVQELLEKAAALRERGCDKIRWHFIGHLQTNKVKSLLPYVHAIHSVDSERLALELAKRCEDAQKRLPVFIEVNLGGEAAKSGLPPRAAPALARTIAAHASLELRGLMCVPEAELKDRALAARFLELRDLEKACRPASAGNLSMGMSSDFELAIAQGATHVRVGTALFGSRA